MPQRAKELHPDAAPGGSIDADAWNRVLTAYQVLATPRSRHLYDLTISQTKQVPSAMRNAARSGLDHSGVAGADVDLSWGLDGRLREKKNARGHDSAVDVLRAELRSEFYAALRHAYFGPSIEELSKTNRFPDCFEADERSHRNATDEILHLVVGRQLFGVVRERGVVSLGASEQTKLRAGLDQELLLETLGREEHLCRQNAAPAARSAAPNDTHRQQDGSVDAPRILDLHIGDECAATAVWHSTRAAIYKQETLVASVVDDIGSQTDAAKVWKIVSPDGRHTHSVLGTVTPLVRHLTFLSEAKVHRRVYKDKLCVARAHRAWLPPSATWLFKPRSAVHDVGGWVISWAGHSQEKHPAWLDPVVICCVAAMATVEGENKRGEKPPLRNRALQWVQASFRKSMQFVVHTFKISR